MPPSPESISEALAALQEGRFADARATIRNDTTPPTIQHFLIEGLSALALGDWPDGHDVFRRATEAFPDHAQFWFNRALAEENLGKIDDAEASYLKSLKLKPDQGEIFGNLSNIYRKAARYPEAVQMACRAIAANAPKAQALNILGLALGKQGNYSEAQKAYDEAVTLAPTDAFILANRANLAVDQQHFDQAWDGFAAARRFDDAAVIQRDEGMARLLAGDYANGLPLYEARLELPNALRVTPDVPRWHGEPLTGKKLLIVSEQGFGDTIQFCRFAPLLQQHGAELIWLVRKPLQRLLASNLPGAVTVEGDAIPASDFWIPILSLPLALGLTGPTAAPLQFKSPPSPLLPNGTGKKKIGLVWKGSATHERDHERSVPLKALAPLWDLCEADFYAPFREADDDIKKLGAPIAQLSSLITDFADMAALIAQLDLLVTVDTAAAHLAGALGVKTYVLTQYSADWRWGYAGESTGWYPNTTLLRQTSYGDWDSVIGRLADRLI